MRHVLTMAIGAASPLAVNYYSIPLTRTNLVLMCSDGLHGVVEHKKLEQILRGTRDQISLEETAARLIEAAKQAGGPDNVTVVLVRKGA
jgi:protein phosphatase